MRLRVLVHEEKAGTVALLRRLVALRFFLPSHLPALAMGVLFLRMIPFWQKKSNALLAMVHNLQSVTLHIF
jgi:hypothetical protein